MKNGLAAGDGSGPLVLGSLRDRKEKASTYTCGRASIVPLHEERVANGVICHLS